MSGNWVEYELRGTWKSPDSSFPYYTGTLVIGYDTIAIHGYSGYGTGLPFGEFTKDVLLEAYSEEGKLFIKDRGNWQQGLPYTIWEDAAWDEHLTLTFGGRDETLHRVD
jgi:hypothetical protein